MNLAPPFRRVATVRCWSRTDRGHLLRPWTLLQYQNSSWRAFVHYTEAIIFLSLILPPHFGRAWAQQLPVVDDDVRADVYASHGLEPPPPSARPPSGILGKNR